MPERNGNLTRQYDLGDGRTLHRWTDTAGQEWACSVYDHGPMCRLCQLVDETAAACLDLAIDGALECRQGPDGGFEFRLTEAGTSQARNLIRRLVEDGEGE